VSSDGRRVLSASADGTVRVWETESGRLVRTFHSVGSPVSAVAVSPDGRLVLSGHEDGAMRLWRLAP
jgi:WD40 repeat protein